MLLAYNAANILESQHMNKIMKGIKYIRHIYSVIFKVYNHIVWIPAGIIIFGKLMSS